MYSPAHLHNRHKLERKKVQILFELASAIKYPSSEDDRYDLIAFFDSFHDMADPLKAAKHALKAQG